MDCDTKDLSNFEANFVSDFDKYRSDGGFCAVIPTKICTIEILADIRILDDGNTLFLKDVMIYPQGEKNFKGKIRKEIFSLVSQISMAGKRLGFRKLIIEGDRLESSTSANPGHHVHIVRNLVELKY